MKFLIILISQNYNDFYGYAKVKKALDQSVGHLIQSLVFTPLHEVSLDMIGTDRINYGFVTSGSPNKLTNFKVEAFLSKWQNCLFDQMEFN